MARQMHHHDQLRGYGGGDCRQGAMIGLWKLRTVPLPKTDDPLMEWKLCGVKNVCPFLGRLTRRVLAVPATSASPERLFSTAGNQMTKKRCGLTCDNLETLVYLHEVCPKTREWESRKN